MGHSAGGVDPWRDAEGHVARIRLGWIGASGFEHLLQSFVPRSGEFGETQPGESSCAIQQGHAIGYRSDRCILTAPGQQTLNLRIVPTCAESKCPREHRSQTCSAELLR